MSLADASKLKKEGNAAFGKGKYAEAVEKYTAAIDLWMEPHDRAVLYSNRSAARLKVCVSARAHVANVKWALASIRAHLHAALRFSSLHEKPLHTSA